MSSVGVSVLPSYKKIPQEDKRPGDDTGVREGWARLRCSSSDPGTLSMFKFFFKYRGFFCSERCSLRADAGMCRAAFPKFYYDSDSASCQSFLYGGCGGNGNKFDSVEECMTACSGAGTGWVKSSV